MEGKKVKKFMDYYQNEDFKKKHLEKMKEKINCNNCNKLVSRCNMCKHQRTTACKNYNNNNNKQIILSIDDLTPEKILELKKILEK